MPRKVDEQGTKKRRRQVLEAAHKCFAQRGFHKSSMADICKKAGLSPGTVYHYFKSKDEIILSFAEKEVKEAKAFAKWLEQAETIRDVVDMSVDAVLQHSVRKDPQVYLEVLCEGGRNPEVGRLLLEADRTVLKALKGRMEELGPEDGKWSVDAMAAYVGGQMTFLEIFKMDMPSTKMCVDMSRMCKKAMMHVLSGRG